MEGRSMNTQPPSQQEKENAQLKEVIEKITFIFEEKIKTSEANIAHLKRHRDRAYARDIQ
jgi:hypothetical protein